jgi:hypothetical protein
MLAAAVRSFVPAAATRLTLAPGTSLFART